MGALIAQFWLPISAAGRIGNLYLVTRQLVLIGVLTLLCHDRSLLSVR